MAEGSTVAEASRKIGVTEQTFYRWRAEYRRVEDRPGATAQAVGDGERPFAASGG